VFYGGFSIYRFVYDEMGPLDSRMMSGLYVPFVVLLTICADRMASARPNGSPLRARAIGKVLVAAALLIFGWHSVTTSRDALRYGTEGRHWGSLTHKLQPIHLFVRGQPEAVALFSNEPQSLFAATYRWPIRNQYLATQPRLVPCRHRLFVWYLQSFLPDGKPIGASVIFEDSTGQVLDLGTCDSDIARFWP